MPTLTIVIPVYNEAARLAENMETLRRQLRSDGLTAELVLVDDGSADASWAVMAALNQNDGAVTCVRLSRNFGKEAALFAGLRFIRTERALVMDADLQHPPRVIRELVETMERTGADIVEGVKADRGRESRLHRWLVNRFYGLLRAMSGLEMRNSSDFKLFGRKVIDTMNAYRESGVFFRGLMEWSGYTRAQVPFTVDERVDGSSRFSTRRLFTMALGSMLSYTSKPLYVTVAVGILFMLGAVILGVQTLVNFFTGQAVSGFTTVILLLLILGALILLCMGIIGAYVARIYNEVKGRPPFIISEILRREEP